jgi:hypothetical protein
MALRDIPGPRIEVAEICGKGPTAHQRKVEDHIVLLSPE